MKGDLLMNYFIKEQLDVIAKQANIQENAAQKTKQAIRAILLFECGAEYARHTRSNHNQNSRNILLKSTINLIDNEVQEIISTSPIEIISIENIIKEVEKMILELKIKGSVREHRNGLIKFHNTMFGSIYGRTKEEIQEKLQEKIEQFNKQPKKDKVEKKKVPLLSEFYQENFLPYKKNQDLSKSTINGYNSRIKFIIERNFDKPLNAYKLKDIEDFIYSFHETRKRQLILEFFNSIYKRAIALSVVKTNPCTALEKPTHKQNQGSAFSFDEITEFLQTLFDNEHLSFCDKCYFIFCLLVGTRKNEALSLTAQDVDFKNKVLHIPGTKTKGSDRQVPLTPLVEKLLLKLIPENNMYFPIPKSSIDKYFRKVWVKSKGHKIHDLRHTYGTIQICVEKVDVKTVSLLMGHSTIDITLRIYTHPEQLDKGTFLRGDLTTDEKLEVYRKKYRDILCMIDNFLD